MASSSSSSAANQSQVPTFYYYPPALAKYQDVVASPQLFMDTLGNLHAAMGTKFMIPIIGGKDLDLHRLFVEVTSRGGIKKVLVEKRWKEVTTIFSFPPSATNASFILRKYYLSLLHHYEQVYYFEANAWTPVSTDAWQNMHSAPISTHVVEKPMQPSAEIQVAPVKQQRLPSAEIVTQAKRPRINAVDPLPGVTPEPSVGCSVTGMIDGKFESGYLVTVKIGSEQFRGVLYQTPQDVARQTTHQGLPPPYQIVNKNTNPTTATSASGVTRRRRRKKSEMKKRDPAHPKPNRSGYNFFFAEQHARLKPLHPGKDRDISRMIGELWNSLNESQRAVYQEKALRDKERYRIEMLHYKENLRVGQIISNAVPAQQQPPLHLDVNVGEVDESLDAEDGGGSAQGLENEMTKSDGSNSEEDDETADNGTPMTTESGAEILGTGTETVNNLGGVFELEKGVLIKIGEGGEECSKSDAEMEAKEELQFGLEEEEEEEEEEDEEDEEESVNVREELSAGAGEEEGVKEEAILPIQDKNAGANVEESASRIQEKVSLEHIQQGIEERKSTTAIQEKVSATPEGGVEKESVPLTIEDGTETKLTSEDTMKKGFTLEEKKEPVGPDERLALVQEGSEAANMDRVGNEDVGELHFDFEERFSSQQQGKRILD